MVTLAEFDLLNVQVEHSDGGKSRCVGSNPIEVQVEHSDQPPLIDFEAATKTRPKPWRCPECAALERTVQADGSWRCQGWGHEGRDPAPVAAIAGGEE
jgi:hypothetical protein